MFPIRKLYIFMTRHFKCAYQNRSGITRVDNIVNKVIAVILSQFKRVDILLVIFMAFSLSAFAYSGDFSAFFKSWDQMMDAADSGPMILISAVGQTKLKSAPRVLDPMTTLPPPFDRRTISEIF